MSKIATEQEAYNIGRSGSYTANKCCTKSRAEELGCRISGSYTETQLVQLEDLSSKYIQLTVSDSTDEGKGYVRASLTIDGTTIINRQNYYHGTYYIEYTGDLGVTYQWTFTALTDSSDDDVDYEITSGNRTGTLNSLSDADIEVEIYKICN